MTTQSDLSKIIQDISKRHDYIMKYMKQFQKQFESNETTVNYISIIERNIEAVPLIVNLLSKNTYQRGRYKNIYGDVDEFHILATAIQSHHKIVEETYDKLIKSLSDNDIKLLFETEQNDLNTNMIHFQQALINATQAKLLSDQFWSKYNLKN